MLSPLLAAYLNIEQGTRSVVKLNQQPRTSATASKDAIATEEATEPAKGRIAVEGPASSGETLGSDVFEQLQASDFDIELERFLLEEGSSFGAPEMSSVSAARIEVPTNDIESAPSPRRILWQDDITGPKQISPFISQSRSPRPASGSILLAPFEGLSTRQSELGDTIFTPVPSPTKGLPDTEEQRSAGRQLGSETSPALGSATRQASLYPRRSASTALTPFHPTLSTNLQTAHNVISPGSADDRLGPLSPPSLDGVLGHHLEPRSAESASYFLNEGPPALQNPGCVIAAAPALEATWQQHPGGRPAKLQVRSRGRQKVSNVPMGILGPLGDTP
jgi:hypothetical protein